MQSADEKRISRQSLYVDVAIIIMYCFKAKTVALTTDQASLVIREPACFPVYAHAHAESGRGKCAEKHSCQIDRNVMTQRISRKNAISR